MWGAYKLIIDAGGRVSTPPRGGRGRAAVSRAGLRLREKEERRGRKGKREDGKMMEKDRNVCAPQRLCTTTSNKFFFYLTAPN